MYRIDVSWTINPCRPKVGQASQNLLPRWMIPSHVARFSRLFSWKREGTAECAPPFHSTSAAREIPIFDYIPILYNRPMLHKTHPHLAIFQTDKKNESAKFVAKHSVKQFLLRQTETNKGIMEESSWELFDSELWVDSLIPMHPAGIVAVNKWCCCHFPIPIEFQGLSFLHFGSSWSLWFEREKASFSIQDDDASSNLHNGKRHWKDLNQRVKRWGTIGYLEFTTTARYEKVRLLR